MDAGRARSRPCSAWADLPVDILLNILRELGRLVSHDFLNMRLVCKSWLAATKEHPGVFLKLHSKSISLEGIHNIVPKLTELLVSTPEDDELTSLIKFSHLTFLVITRNRDADSKMLDKAFKIALPSSLEQLGMYSMSVDPTSLQEANLPKLTSLDWNWDANLSPDDAGACLQKLPKLKDLLAGQDSGPSTPRFTGFFSKALASLTELTRLRLQNVSLKIDPGRAFDGSPSNLRELHLSSIRGFNVVWLESMLQSLTQLTVLVLDSINNRNFLMAGAAQGQPLPSLRSLRMFGCDPGFLALAPPSLESLTWSDPEWDLWDEPSWEVWKSTSSSLTALTYLRIDAGTSDTYKGPGLCPLGGPSLLEIHLQKCQGLEQKLVVPRLLPRLMRLKIENYAYLGERPLSAEHAAELYSFGKAVLSIRTLHQISGRGILFMEFMEDLLAEWERSQQYDCVQWTRRGVRA